MALVNVKFRGNVYQLVSDDAEKICSLAEKVNTKAEDLAKQSKNATDSKIAFMLSLMLQDQIDNTAKPAAPTHDTEKVLADTLTYVANYINHLADKFEKR
jgi:cell division protein ZapA (FtsZ GTPase activity inhibitor)